MRNALFLVTALGALCLAGCGNGATTTGSGGSGGTGGSGGSGGTGGGESVDDACKALATALCGQLDTCSAFLMKATYVDKATCEARVAARCVVPTKLAGSHVDAAGIQTCADAYNKWTCGDILGPGPSECRIPGDKADGASCGSSAECKGTLCKIPVEGSCGTCATLLAKDAACDPNDDLCAGGMFCAASQKCTVYSGMGEACSESAPCNANLSCNAGKCGPLQPEGASCAKGEACDIRIGLSCSPIDGTCIKLTIAADGETCGFDQNKNTGALCVGDDRCDATKKCVPRPKEGEACTIDPDTKKSACESGYDCLGGKCLAAVADCK